VLIDIDSLVSHFLLLIAVVLHVHRLSLADAFAACVFVPAMTSRLCLHLWSLRIRRSLHDHSISQQFNTTSSRKLTRGPVICQPSLSASGTHWPTLTANICRVVLAHDTTLSANNVTGQLSGELNGRE